MYSQNDLGWKKPLKIIWSNPPAIGRDIFHFMQKCTVCTVYTEKAFIDNSVSVA